MISKNIILTKPFFKLKLVKLYYNRKSKLNRNLRNINLNISSSATTTFLTPYNSRIRLKQYSQDYLRSYTLVSPFRSNLIKQYNLKYSYTFFLQKAIFKSYISNLLRVFQKNDLVKYTSKNITTFLKKNLVVSNIFNNASNKFLHYFKLSVQFNYSWNFWKNDVLFFRKSINSYLNLYSTISLPILLSLYRKFNKVFYKPFVPIFNLYWTFTFNQKLFINLRNKTDRYYNYFSLYSGLFLKFFQNRKPLRKSKLFKTLMVKFLRKIILISSIKFIYLVVNRASQMFSELYKLLLTPSIIPYKVPQTKGFYNDSITNKYNKLFSVRKVLFKRTHSFTNLKTRRRGRIKRKITRRLFRKNSVLD